MNGEIVCKLFTPLTLYVFGHGWICCGSLTNDTSRYGNRAQKKLTPDRFTAP